jgi:hypothetical protein
MSEQTEKSNEEKVEKELDILKTEVFPNIKDGSLLVVTVGNEKTPATKSDMERVADTVNAIFEGVNGISVLIVPHLVNIERLPLPALRNIQSKVVNSWNDNESVVIDLDDSLGMGIFGG